MTTRKCAILAGAALTVLAGVSVWSIFWMARQRADAQTAAEDRSECRSLARTIALLRDRPTVAATEDMGTERLSARIEAARAQAQFAGRELDGVFPQPPRRLGDSPYLEAPTSLVLRGVTLARLAAFLHYLSDGSGLNVRDLVLRAPRGDAPRDTWDAEATLTYLIYAPVGKGGHGS